MKFSDRYGYTTPCDVLIVEDMPQEVANAICTLLDATKVVLERIANQDGYYYADNLTYGKIEKAIWTRYLNRYSGDLIFNYGNCKPVAEPYFRDRDIKWYDKLNLLEFIVNYLYDYAQSETNYMQVLEFFVSRLNREFERLFYGYRIIDYIITPITDDEEIKAIKVAAIEYTDNVHVHIEAALSHFAKRPEPDYRNSIKESISAIECLCREITKKSTLDDAIPVLKSKGVQLNPQFEEGLKRIYYYTNDKRTGIRHALMDDAYVPTMADAKYMLVICSAFVNYIRSLIPQVND